ncbi:hypothetical protein CIL06_11495 [Pantoea vagans]|uniref:hypothetical protein n=1 Tax=Pantoea vagans TaxID=470934 RepID=UPI000BACB30A|nr:hypothetical protein [Pantoea vagans]PAW36288.1 hypothetical protein CIL06_11495 [Pantoea vagans]
MTEEEWLDGLRHLSSDQILQAHFSLQEQIKKHYKLRSEAVHLKKTIALCKQHIALAPIALEALKQNPHMYSNGVFSAPAHHGYRQYAVILRRQKDFDTLDGIESKRKSEGWAD